MRLIRNQGSRALDVTLAEADRPRYRLLSATLRGGRVTLATLAATGAPQAMLSLAPGEVRALRMLLAAAPDAPGTAHLLDPESDTGTRALATDAGGIALMPTRGTTLGISRDDRDDLIAGCDAAIAAIDTHAVPAA